MENIVYHEAKIFIDKCKKNGGKYLGRTATKEEIKILSSKFGEQLPHWYYDLISKLPLIDMEIGWEAQEAEENYDGIEYVQICNAQFMIDESFGAYPGIPILEKGYICIGIDPGGSGDPYFINFNNDNPTVYQIFHDIGQDAESILEHGRIVVAEQLSDLFKNGKYNL